MSRTPRRSCAGRAGNQEKPQTSAPGRPQRPSPAPAAKFPKTDTLPGRARGGAHGLPRWVPWRPRPRHPPRLLTPQDRRAKGRPKDARPRRLPRFPSRRHPARPERGRRDTDTDIQRTAPRGGRPRRPPRAPHSQSQSPGGQLCKFPLDLSLSKGHSRSGTESLTATAPAGPPCGSRRRKPNSGPASPAAPDQGANRRKQNKQTTTRGREKEEMPSDIKRKRSPLTAPRINYKKKKERRERKPKRNPDCQNMKHGRASSPATPARATGVPAPHRRPQPGLGRPSEARGPAVGTPGRQAGRQAREGPHECLWNRVVPLLGGPPARSAESGDPGGGAAGGGQGVVLT